MTTGIKRSANWTQVGQSETSPLENKVRAEIRLDTYYVVVGFEVNKPRAFIDEVHDLALDYGHAFFYLVKNVTVVTYLSFGPAGLGKQGWFNKGGGRAGRNVYDVGAFKKDGYANARPGTPDYPVTEPVKAFRLFISQKQAKNLEDKTNKLRVEIYNGNVMYSAIMNDTCAETAKETLDDADISTPSGYGLVKHSHMLNFPVAYAVNPYKWHKDFRKHYQEANFKPDIPGEWLPLVGEADPIFGIPNFVRRDPVFGVAL